MKIEEGWDRFKVICEDATRLLEKATGHFNSMARHFDELRKEAEGRIYDAQSPDD